MAALNCSDQTCWPGHGHETRCFCLLAQAGVCAAGRHEPLIAQNCSRHPGYATIRNWYLEPRDIITLPTRVFLADILALLHGAGSSAAVDRILGDLAECGLERLQSEGATLDGKHVHTCLHMPEPILAKWLHVHTFTSDVALASPEAPQLALRQGTNKYFKWVATHPNNWYCHSFAADTRAPGGVGTAGLDRTQVGRAILRSAIDRSQLEAPAWYQPPGQPGLPSPVDLAMGLAPQLSLPHRLASWGSFLPGIAIAIATAITYMFALSGAHAIRRTRCWRAPSLASLL